MRWSVRWDIALVVILFAFLLGLALRCGREPSHERIVHERESVTLRRDTVRTVVEVPIRPIAHGWHSTERKAIAPAHRTEPMIYSLDTTLLSDSLALAPDTISIRHILPVDSFALRIRFSPRRNALTIPYLARDSLYARLDTIHLSRASPLDESLSVLAAIVGGFILGRALR